MKKIIRLVTCVLMLFIHLLLNAQNDSKVITNPSVVRYIIGGYTKSNKIYLITNKDYNTLSIEDKGNIIKEIIKDFDGYDITVYSGGQQRELWLSENNKVAYLEHWNNDSLKIENYMPLELKRNGETKVFYYVGGSFNGSNGYSNGSLNLRVGSYLYKNFIDVSGTLNLGYNKTGGKSQFAGDVGMDSRGYLPFRIKNFNMAPYVGAGISYAFSPSSYFELRLLAGGCWFIGPGSMDIGLQYGLKSKLSFTLGYTLHLNLYKKLRK